MRRRDEHQRTLRLPTPRLVGRELLGAPRVAAGVGSLAIPATVAAMWAMPSLLASSALGPAVGLIGVGGGALFAGVSYGTSRIIRWGRERARPASIASCREGWVTVRGRIACGPHPEGTLVAHADAVHQASARLEVLDETGIAIVDDDLLVLPDPPLGGRFELRVGDVVTVAGFATVEDHDVEHRASSTSAYRGPTRARVLVFDGRVGAPIRIARVTSRG